MVCQLICRQLLPCHELRGRFDQHFLQTDVHVSQKLAQVATLCNASSLRRARAVLVRGSKCFAKHSQHGTSATFCEGVLESVDASKSLDKAAM